MEVTDTVLAKLASLGLHKIRKEGDINRKTYAGALRLLKVNENLADEARIALNKLTENKNPKDRTLRQVWIQDFTREPVNEHQNWALSRFQRKTDTINLIEERWKWTDSQLMCIPMPPPHKVYKERKPTTAKKPAAMKLVASKKTSGSLREGDLVEANGQGDVAGEQYTGVDSSDPDDDRELDYIN